MRHLRLDQRVQLTMAAAMNRQTAELLREIYSKAANEHRAELERLKASTEEFSREGEDLKPQEITRQEASLAEYEKLLAELPT
jgi:hypothetical protein